MDEVIALENEIMAALPAADRAAGMMEHGRLGVAVIYAQDLLCNAWSGPGQRIDRLRSVAAELRRFNA